MSSNHQPQSRDLLPLAHWLANLKRLKRTGWLDRGIPESAVESVADHSLAVALLAWAAAEEARSSGATLNPARVALLALIHDLPEAVTGDSPPYDRSAIPSGIDADERRSFLNLRHIRSAEHQQLKQRTESAAMRQLVSTLPGVSADALSALWAELERAESEEARFVKQVDRLETFLQSRLYLELDASLSMESFQQEVMETVSDPTLAATRDRALEFETEK